MASDITIRSYCDESQWPIEDIKELFVYASPGNWVLQEDPTLWDNMLAEWKRTDSALFGAYNAAGVLVGGLSACSGDFHIRKCLCISIAVVRPEYRHSSVTAKLYKAALDLGRFMEYTHVSTTTYAGNGKYITKYRRLRNG